MSFQQLMMLACSCRSGLLLLRPVAWNWTALHTMENVWEYLRANKVCALVGESYDAIVAACKAAWDFLIQDPDRIRSIGQRDWACVKA